MNSLKGNFIYTIRLANFLLLYLGLNRSSTSTFYSYISTTKLDSVTETSILVSNRLDTSNLFNIEKI